MHVESESSSFEEIDIDIYLENFRQLIFSNNLPKILSDAKDLTELLESGACVNCSDEILDLNSQALFELLENQSSDELLFILLNLFIQLQNRFRYFSTISFTNGSFKMFISLLNSSDFNVVSSAFTILRNYIPLDPHTIFTHVQKYCFSFLSPTDFPKTQLSLQFFCSLLQYPFSITDNDFSQLFSILCSLQFTSDPTISSLVTTILFHSLANYYQFFRNHFNSSFVNLINNLFNSDNPKLFEMFNILLILTSRDEIFIHFLQENFNFPILLQFLMFPNNEIIIQTLKVISNFISDKKEVVKIFLDLNVFDVLVNILESSVFSVKLQTIFCLLEFLHVDDINIIEFILGNPMIISVILDIIPNLNNDFVLLFIKCISCGIDCAVKYEKTDFVLECLNQTNFIKCIEETTQERNEIADEISVFMSHIMVSLDIS